MLNSRLQQYTEEVLLQKNSSQKSQAVCRTMGFKSHMPSTYAAPCFLLTLTPSLIPFLQDTSVRERMF